jgi:hypothetical protein
MAERPLLARLQVESWLASADNCELRSLFVGLNWRPDSTKPRRCRTGRGFVNTGGVHS